MQEEIVIQDCGCISIPEEIAASLGMAPGQRLSVRVDETSRTLTLAAIGTSQEGEITRAACPIRP